MALHAGYYSRTMASAEKYFGCLGDVSANRNKGRIPKFWLQHLQSLITYKIISFTTSLLILSSSSREKVAVLSSLPSYCAENKKKLLTFAATSLLVLSHIVISMANIVPKGLVVYNANLMKCLIELEAARSTSASLRTIEATYQRTSCAQGVLKDDHVVKEVQAQVGVTREVSGLRKIAWG
jgi:hypothetical protein